MSLNNLKSKINNTKLKTSGEAINSNKKYFLKLHISKIGCRIMVFPFKLIITT
jgi:hypothetical protein